MKLNLSLNRPIVGVVLLFIVGIITGRYASIFPHLLLFFYFIQVILLFFSFFTYLRKKKITTFLIFMNIFFLGVVHFSVCYFPSPRDIVYFASSKTSIEVIGKIITRPQIREGKRKNITFIIEAKKIRTDKKEETTWQKTEGKVWVRSFFPYLKNFTKFKYLIFAHKVTNKSDVCLLKINTQL